MRRPPPTFFGSHRTGNTAKRTTWIIDGAYLLKAAPWKFDFFKLKYELQRECGAPLAEAYYLNSVSAEPNEAQDAFHNWLKSAPPRGPKMRVQLYSLKSMRVICPRCGETIDRPVQRGVDVGIATLILKLAVQDQYDRLILAAGDGDFEDAISYVKSDLHKEIWMCGFTDTMSVDLQSYADRVLWLDEWQDTIRRVA